MAIFSCSLMNPDLTKRIIRKVLWMKVLIFDPIFNSMAIRKKKTTMKVFMNTMQAKVHDFWAIHSQIRAKVVDIFILEKFVVVGMYFSIYYLVNYQVACILKDHSQGISFNSSNSSIYYGILTHFLIRNIFNQIKRSIN